MISTVVCRIALYNRIECRIALLASPYFEWGKMQILFDDISNS